MRTPVAVGGLFALVLLFLCNALFSGIFALTLLAGLVMLFILSLTLLPNKQKKNTALALLFCILPLISFCFFYFFRYLPDRTYAGQEITVKGMIFDEPVEYTGSTVYIVTPLSASAGGKKITLHGSIKVTDYAGIHAGLFDVVTFTITPRVIEKSSLFDFSMRERSSGRYLSGMMKDGSITGSTAKSGLAYCSAAIRQAVKNAVDRYVKAGSRGIATAITTGDKSELDTVTEKGFLVAGVMHLTAVSGTHFVFILGFILFLFDLLAVNRRKTYIVCLAAGAFICLAAGFTPSVMRSFLVSVIMYIGLLVYRETEPFHTLMASGLIIMLYNPFAPGGLSFLMSFLAAAGIITMSPPFTSFLNEHVFNKIRRGQKVIKAVAGILISTFAAGLFTLPLSAFSFKYVSTITPMTKLLLVPPASILPLIVFLMTAASPIPVIASVFGFITGLFTGYISFLLQIAASMEETMVYADKPYLYIISGLLILCFLLSHFKLIKVKKLTATFVAAALLLTCISVDTLLLPAVDAAEDNALTIKFIDVGQGDSTLIAKDGSGVLVDGGGDYTAAGSIEKQLELSHVRSLQAVILTHAHADHINALSEVIRYKSPRLLVLPQSGSKYPEMLEDLITLALSSGTALKNADTDLAVDAIENVDIRVLTHHIDKDELTGSENEFSNVIRVTAFDTTALIMGDVDETVWRFAKYYGDTPVDILRVGHHGSEGAVTDDFLLHLKPSYAIISVAKDNSYGLPSSDTVNLLKKSSVPTLQTALNGTITAKITAGKKIFFSVEKGNAA